MAILLKANNKMNERKAWIDSVRGIAFLMVIYSHLQYCSPSLMRYFEPIFLTTFFFVSGYLFKRAASFSAMFEQRVRTLIIPFVIYGVLNIVASQLFTFNKGSHGSFKTDVIDFFVQIRGYNDGLWFIACLFTASIFFFPLAKYIRNSKVLILVSMFLFAANRFLDLPPIPWHLQFVGYAMFYMSLGIYYKENEDKLAWLNHRISMIAATLLYLLGVTLYWVVTNGAISFGSTKFIIDGWVITVFGIVVCVSFSKKLCNVRFLQFIGANSLLYFALHGKGYTILQIIVEKVMRILNVHHTLSSDFVLGLSIAALDAALVAIPVVLINRYAQFTLGKGFSLSFWSQGTSSQKK